MSYFLFLDESGQDRREAPYEVLAGVSVQDTELWNLIQRIHSLEDDLFGMRITEGRMELKGKKLLKRKTFRHAGQLEPLKFHERTALACSCLQKGQSEDPAVRQSVSQKELTALAQAKIDFVSQILEVCSQHRARAFASIVSKEAEKPEKNDFLRKDYAYLFERFYYYLEDKASEPMGVVVFDELEKSRCHLLVNQMEEYFLKTTKGRMRSSRIVPEPFFVHSDLTTAIQLADLVAYITSWGVQVGNMEAPARKELKPLAEKVCQLRYKALRTINDQDDFTVWSFAVFDDLRPKEEA